MLDLTKPVQTRNGRPVRILATDAKGGQSVAGLVTDRGGYETAYLWSAHGHHFGNDADNGPRVTDDFDLVNVPEPKKTGTMWLNVYPNVPSAAHSSRPAADLNATHSRLACIRVDWAEGQFDT